MHFRSLLVRDEGSFNITWSLSTKLFSFSRYFWKHSSINSLEIFYINLTWIYNILMLHKDMYIQKNSRDIGYSGTITYMLLWCYFWDRAYMYSRERWLALSWTQLFFLCYRLFRSHINFGCHLWFIINSFFKIIIYKKKKNICK